VVVKSDATFVMMGNLHDKSVVFAVIGFFTIVSLDHFKVRGSILIGILTVTVLGLCFDANVQMPKNLVSLPPSIAPIFMQLDVAQAWSKGIFNVVLVFVLVEVFDATGVLSGVARRAGLLNRPDGINKALSADSVAILGGSVLGTSSTTAYIESLAGIQAGGRTGLTALTIGILFLAALFFSPLITIVPMYATAPALVYVAALMLSELSHVKWDKLTEAVPAALTVFAMPFTFSIANGLAFGFISYTTLKLLTGQWRDVHPAAWVIAILFTARFIFLDGH
jgi:AGZA family xanthine/uracil permease-like MFS transporter